jgi:hypothetical protein
MPLHPETCAHCSSAIAMTQQAFEMKAPPPDAIRAALLLGIVVGENAALENVEMPMCNECGTQIEKLRRQFFGTSPPDTSEEPEQPAPEEPASQS